jgi:CelD/BcsL family acetyltransferase involved in cellulose biosynthesis
LRKYKYRLLAQPIEFFERIWEIFAPQEGAITLLADIDGTPIAGGLFLVWGDTMYYKFGASLAEYLPLRPNDALFWAAIQCAADRGLRAVDWGLSDLDQPGLVKFKRKWASIERRIVTLCRPAVVDDVKSDVDQMLGELSRLFTDAAVPDEITARAGALLYRHFC